MAEHEHHCPFLNRPDGRCAEHFHLDQLEHAFAYCFDRYAACPVYVERLVERRVRQGSIVPQGQHPAPPTLLPINIPPRHSTARPSSSTWSAPSPSAISPRSSAKPR